jgi:acetyl-CoA C-acetyltransferase
LAAVAATGALERAGVEPREVDAVFMGNARPAGNGPNPARQVAIRIGLPHATPATTVNMACGSGLQSILLGVQQIQLGRARTVLVGGSESMSNVPYLLPKARGGHKMGHLELVDGMYRDGFHCPIADQLMGATAETLAREYGISREDQDAQALSSQARATSAAAAGHFDAELVAVPAQGRAAGLEADEHPRADSSLAKLAKLAPVFDPDGGVTAGNSSGLTDGASMLLLRRVEDVAKPLATILDYEVAGVDPARMGIGPVPATRSLLDRQGLSISDLDLIELNEAFAAQLLACAADLSLDLESTNVHGGAIALGHPIAASGARITTTLLHALRTRAGGLGLATLCVSGGMGVSLLVRNGKA